MTETHDVAADEKTGRDLLAAAAEAVRSLTVELSEEQLETARRLSKVRREIGGLRREETALRDSLLDALRRAGADRGLTASGARAVYLEVQGRRQINARKLEALWPDVFVEVAEENEVTVLKLDV